MGSRTYSMKKVDNTCPHTCCRPRLKIQLENAKLNNCALYWHHVCTCQCMCCQERWSSSKKVKGNASKSIHPCRYRTSGLAFHSCPCSCLSFFCLNLVEVLGHICRFPRVP